MKYSYILTSAPSLSIIAPKKKKKGNRLRDAYQKRLFQAKFDCGLEPAQKSQIKASKVGCQPSNLPLSCHQTRETAVLRERERKRERASERESHQEQWNHVLTDRNRESEARESSRESERVIERASERQGGRERKGGMEREELRERERERREERGLSILSTQNTLWEGGSEEER